MTKKYLLLTLAIFSLLLAPALIWHELQTTENRILKLIQGHGVMKRPIEETKKEIYSIIADMGIPKEKIDSLRKKVDSYKNPGLQPPLFYLWVDHIEDTKLEHKGYPLRTVRGALVFSSTGGRMGDVSNSVIISQGPLIIGNATNSIILAKGRVDISFSNSVLVIGFDSLSIAHDGAGDKGYNDSIFMLKNLLQISHTKNSLVYAGQHLDISHAKSVTFLKPSNIEETSKNFKELIVPPFFSTTRTSLAKMTVSHSDFKRAEK